MEKEINLIMKKLENMYIDNFVLINCDSYNNIYGTKFNGIGVPMYVGHLRIMYYQNNKRLENLKLNDILIKDHFNSTTFKKAYEDIKYNYPHIHELNNDAYKMQEEVVKQTYSVKKR